MPTKLTLSINEQTINKAKEWAKRNHTSLSGLVENYFESLISKNNSPHPLSKKTSTLSGMFKKHDEDLSYKELITKYKAHG